MRKMHVHLNAFSIYFAFKEKEIPYKNGMIKRREPFKNLIFGHLENIF
jgi:hypothetical protein